MSGRAVPLTILFFAAALVFAVIYFFDPSFFDLTLHGNSQPSPSLGKIESVEGSVAVRARGTTTFTLAGIGKPLHHQDMIWVKERSKALIVLGEAGQLELNEFTRIIVENLPDPSGAVSVTIIDGEPKILSTHPTLPDLFLKIIKKGRVHTASEWQKHLQRESSPPRLASESSQMSPTLVSASNASSESVPTGSATPKEGASLTDTEIKSQLAMQTSFFKKCYLSHIHRAHTQGESLAESQALASGGAVVVSFVIQPKGKVTQLRIIRTDFTDDTLHRCLLDVVQRTPFKTLESDPVAVAEFPITFN